MPAMLAAGWVLGALISAASPPPLEWPAGVARFSFEWGGVPVGTVEFEGRCYRSTHLFARGAPRVRTDCETQGLSWRLLLRRTSVGCTPVREELTRREGELCVERREGAVDHGTAFDQAFRGRYGRDGTLEELVLGVSRFVRSARPLARPGGSPLAAGFKLERDGGGTLELHPPVKNLGFAPLKGATPPGRAAVEAWLREERAELAEGDCLGLARRLVERFGSDSAEILYGLAEEGGRVFPHAWVRVLTRDAGVVQLDGALGLPVTRRTHLPLATSRQPGGAGRVYQELLEGSTTVVRLPLPTRTE